MYSLTKPHSIGERRFGMPSIERLNRSVMRRATGIFSLHRRRVPVVLGLVFLVGVVTVPLAGFLLFVLIGARDNAYRQFDQQNLHLISGVVERVNQHLQPVGVLCEYLAELVASGKADPQDVDTFSQQMLGALAALPQVRTLAFIDTKYHVLRVGRDGTVKQSDWSTDPKIRQTLDDPAAGRGAHWGDFFFAESTRSTLLNYRAPLRRNGVFLGQLIAVVSIEDISNFLATAPNRYLHNSFILTDDDRVIAHPHLGNRKIAGLSDQTPLPKIAQIEDPILAAGSAAIRDHGQTVDTSARTSFSFSATDHGQTYFFVLQSIAGFSEKPWLVGLYLPASMIDVPLHRLTMMGIGGASLLLAALGFAAMIGRCLVRPIRRIAAAAKQIRVLRTDPMKDIGNSAFLELDQAMTAFNDMRLAIGQASIYLPRSLVRRLLRRGGGDPIKPEERLVTVLFTDICGFTSMTEKMLPADVANLLNEHFTLLADCIESEDGTIDKYMGDGLMAFWGAPEVQHDHAERALSAALKIADAIHTDNRRRRAAGQPPINLRLGMHTGPALVSNIGSPSRLNYTIVGDTVNVAQRIERLSKEFFAESQDVTVLISAATNACLGCGLESFSIGERALDGYVGSVEIFRVA